MSSYIVQSSGSPALDQETLAMLVRAHPMPRQLSFVAPVRFTIT
jgi:outer membrane biosynthesis protein TonB